MIQVCDPITVEEVSSISWAKIDDHYFSNPKIVRLSGPAKYLHLTSIIWCAGQPDETGVMPKQILPVLGVMAGIPAKALKDAAKQLIESNLWEDHDQDWVIHDFIPFITPEKREAARRRLADWRAKQRTSAHRETVTEPVPNDAETQDETRFNAERNDTPVPVPVPVPDIASSNEEARRLCETLIELLKENGCKAPEKVPDKWLVEADRLLRLDKRSLDDALSLLNWAASDVFWRANILSMPTFRSKYDQLRMHQQRSASGPPRPVSRAVRNAMILSGRRSA